MSIIRGTTPTLHFCLPFDTGILAQAFVTIQQNGATTVEKTLADCTCEGNKLSLRLSQEDTLKLGVEDTCEIQIRAKTAGGDVIASNIIRVSTGRILKDGVI